MDQGLPVIVDGTDTFDFINKNEVPLDHYKDVPYGQIFCSYREVKTDPYQEQLVPGGNIINYPGDLGTPTADILIVKLLLNSVVSTPGAEFFTADTSSFYLITPRKCKKYVGLNLSYMLEDVVEHCYIFIAIKREMYGLPQAGLLSQGLLEERVGKRGYYQSEYTTVLWLHKTCSIELFLCVDDFEVKYVREEDKKHLLNSLNKYNKVTVDNKGIYAR